MTELILGKPLDGGKYGLNCSKYLCQKNVESIHTYAGNYLGELAEVSI